MQNKNTNVSRGKRMTDHLYQANTNQN